MSGTRRSVLITGASAGIGAAIARRFAGEPGHRLVLLARGRSRLAATAARCRDAGAEVLELPTDVTEPAQVEAAAHHLLTRHGAPDVVVSNAGAFMPGGVLDTSLERFRQQLRVNLESAFLLLHALLPSMVERGQGHVVLMGSVASIQGYPTAAAYCAAKHGLLGLGRALREEVRAHGVVVTTVLPGATWTASWEHSGLPPERFMADVDVAEAVWSACALGPRAVVEEIVLRPSQGDV